MIRYRDLSTKQKALICNGCGPKGGWIPVPEFFCHASCDHHDFNYWIGCTSRDRRKADFQFYREMRHDAGCNPLKLGIALSYFVAVRTCGAAFFNFAERERDEVDLVIALVDLAPPTKGV